MTTDLIVGFPGETDDDFEATLEVAAEAAYDSAYTFIYSPRPGTEAAERSSEFVAPEVVADRFARLRVVIERSRPGPPPGPGRPGRGGPDRGPEQEGSGRAERTHAAEQARAPGPAVRAPMRPGTFADVRITAGSPHHLMGELVEVTAAPRHRTRIPVASV